MSKPRAKITDTDNEGDEDENVMEKSGIDDEDSAKPAKPDDGDSSDEGIRNDDRDENQG